MTDRQDSATHSVQAPARDSAEDSVGAPAQDTVRDSGQDALQVPAPNPVPESDSGADEERPTWPALLKGWHRRCPRCGSGPMLSGYLKVRDHCPVCREPLHHHRADDGPAYLTILIVGHLMAPLLHVGFTTFRPDPLVLFTFFTVGCVGLSLYLLPRLKGALVAFQWARHMHGFGPSQRTPQQGP